MIFFPFDETLVFIFGRPNPAHCHKTFTARISCYVGSLFQEDRYQEDWRTHRWGVPKNRGPDFFPSETHNAPKSLSISSTFHTFNIFHQSFHRFEIPFHRQREPWETTSGSRMKSWSDKSPWHQWWFLETSTYISSFVNVKGYLQFAEFSSLEHERFRQFEIWWTCGIFVEWIHEIQIIEISNAILKPSSIFVNSWTDAGIQLENGECLCEATCLATPFVLRKLPSVFVAEEFKDYVIQKFKQATQKRIAWEESRSLIFFYNISQVVRRLDFGTQPSVIDFFHLKCKAWRSGKRTWKARGGKAARHRARELDPQGT